MKLLRNFVHFDTHCPLIKLAAQQVILPSYETHGHSENNSALRKDKK